MKMLISCFAFMVVVFLPLRAETEPATKLATEPAYARIQTSMGVIDLELYPEKAPLTVDNFLTYAQSGYYDRLIFHRVVAGRLIQGGGYTTRLNERALRDPIQNEADNGLKNLRGTIAMARNDDPHSARAQFYINLKDNPELDFRDKELRANWGYAVFGKVIGGMNVAEAIGAVSVGPKGPFDQHVPLEPVIIKRIDRIEADEVMLQPGKSSVP
ncbi:MAG: peptidylprolyl isomerase [bacterium]